MHILCIRLTALEPAGSKFYQQSAVHRKQVPATYYNIILIYLHRYRNISGMFDRLSLYRCRVVDDKIMIIQLNNYTFSGYNDILELVIL
jgi:hypothetical protein